MQNLHFSNNGNDDKTKKSCKNSPVIEHLNKLFAKNLLKSPSESVDKHMHKFKGKSSMKQYIRTNRLSGALNIGIDVTTGYVYQLELHQGRKEKREFNLGLNECGTRFLPSCGRYLLSRVFQ